MKSLVCGYFECCCFSVFFLTQKWFKSLQIIHFPVNMLLIFKNHQEILYVLSNTLQKKYDIFAFFGLFYINTDTFKQVMSYIAYLCIFVSVWYMCYSVLIRTVKISCVIIMNFSLMLLGLFHSNELIAVVLLLKTLKC